jgi:ribosomal protein S18 acetylase RimI-like enzyme
VEYTIRDASVDDADAIGSVSVRAWQAAYRGIMPDAYLDGLRAEERAATWRQGLADPRPEQHVRVVTVGGDVVGFAASGPEAADVTDGETGELYAINVDPDHWGRGLGRVLLGEVHRGFADAGYHTAVLWVATDNARARRFYESEGWAAEGLPRDADALGVMVNEVRYRKRLDA